MKRGDTWKRYAATENGTVRKHWRGKIRVALVYPNYYPVGMSNLGLQAVYALFTKRELSWLDRRREMQTTISLQEGPRGEIRGVETW